METLADNVLKTTTKQMEKKRGKYDNSTANNSISSNDSFKSCDSNDCKSNLTVKTSMPCWQQKWCNNNYNNNNNNNNSWCDGSVINNNNYCNTNNSTTTGSITKLRTSLVDFQNSNKQQKEQKKQTKKVEHLFSLQYHHVFSQPMTQIQGLLPSNKQLDNDKEYNTNS